MRAVVASAAARQRLNLSTGFSQMRSWKEGEGGRKRGRENPERKRDVYRGEKGRKKGWEGIRGREERG